MGIRGLRLLVGHILPLCLPSAIVRLALDLAGIILAAAGLGFLGLGARPPMAEWGDDCRRHAGDFRPVVDCRHSAAPSFCQRRLTCWAMACATYWSHSMTEHRVIVDALNIDYPPRAWSTT